MVINIIRVKKFEIAVINGSMKRKYEKYGMYKFNHDSKEFEVKLTKLF